MNTFFGPQGSSFVAYSTQHLAALAGLAIALLLIVLLRRPLRGRPGAQRALRHGLGALLLVLFALLQLWYIVNGRWSAAESLPLQLSTLTLLLAAVLMFRPGRRLFEFVYFAGIGGALQALFTPVLDVGFPHFWYVYFFAGHGGTVLAPLYLAVVEGYRPRGWGAVVRTVLWIDALVLLLLPINAWTGGNYMFVSRKPSTLSLLDALGPWPWYLVWLQLVALLLFAVLMLPFSLARRREGRRQRPGKQDASAAGPR
ncbi:TIGR02206 family membrane protein [Paenibacillus sp. IB182496]|uniref:TIGR02206 family membrane protein n=1 Tax=Paenibacillus sabuli TaxID=2772509 RepID=A0A927GT37_9BACL|nr:TIGR02206 family membrane protein [Paenibacillus sabuli]MBD2847203.1 TIGR02206 family membrane protein [Paenibacillus sabuli]